MLKIANNIKCIIYLLYCPGYCTLRKRMGVKALSLVIIAVIKIVSLDCISYTTLMINLDLLLIKQKITIQIHMRKIEKPELISTIRDK